MPGVTLTIQPGTVIKFNGGYNLNVGGTLIADGTAAQPIRFESNTGGQWGQIGFGDSSSDASVDADYNYLGGSILRYVVIDQSALPAGIGCSSATPYLSHLTLSSGLNCTVGALTVDGVVTPNTGVLFDSRTLSGTVSFDGNALVWRNVLVANGSIPLLYVSGRASVMNNASGDVSVGDGSLVQGNVVTGRISIGGSGVVVQNVVNGGGISVGGQNAPSVVLTNTIRGGGTYANYGITTHYKDVEVRDNDIEGLTQLGSAWGIVATSITATEKVTITHNRLVNNNNGIQLAFNYGDALVKDNLIANSAGIGLQLSAGSILSNTFVGNHGSAIRVQSFGLLPNLSGNNFEGNVGAYDLEVLHTGSIIQAQNNWWGTTNTVAIANRIYDFSDDFNLAVVQYQPLLSSPSQDAPAYVRRVTVLPDSTLGLQAGTFEVEFSRPMNNSVSPEIKFASGLMWASRANLPAPQSGLGAATANNGKIYAIDGYYTEEYDPAANAWTSRASLPTPQFFSGVVAANNGKVYAIGGYTETLTTDASLGTVEEYDPATNTWTSRASMPTPRFNLGVAAASNGKIYAIGGVVVYYGSYHTVGVVEEYDPATNTWTSRASLPTPQSGLAAVAASNGKIYAISEGATEEYDPATDTWTSRASMPTPPISL